MTKYTKNIPTNPEEQKRIKKAGAEVDAYDGHLYTKSSSLAVSRSIGDFEYKKNQKLCATDQVVSPLANVIQRDIDDSWQFILLACDGIWNQLSNGEAVNFILSGIGNGKIQNKFARSYAVDVLTLWTIPHVLACFLHKKTLWKTCYNM